MPAAVTDKFRKGAAAFSTTLASQKAAAASSCTLSSGTGLPTDTAVDLTIGRVDSSGTATPSAKAVYKATISGTTASNLTLVEGTDQLHEAGTVVEVTHTASTHNDAVDGILVEHKQDGTHSDVTADSVTVTDLTVSGDLTISGVASDGWTATGGTHSVATGYNAGNRSFNIATSTDLSSIVSPGMRYRVTRGTTAPTQCADLESSSSQYASKTSPTGITFTDDFTCEAWVKLESYGSRMGIVTRFSSTGWQLNLESDGTVRVVGQGGGLDVWKTYQSIPLDKWTHVAATLDISGGTTSTNKIFIDGVDVPITQTSNTATTITQAGNLQVGGTAGADFFDGKLADVRVWSDIRTATEIKDNMFEYPSDTTGLVGHWKLNGNFNDSSTNANNLTASGGAVATDSDNPWNDTEYGIITKVTSSAIQVQCPEGYGIPNDTLSSPFYSTQKAPFGFPAEESKWEVVSHYRITESAKTNTTFEQWYGTQIGVPIGTWVIGYSASLQVSATGNDREYVFALSTSTSSDSEAGLLSVFLRNDDVKNTTLIQNREISKTMTAQTDFYFITKVNLAQSHLLASAQSPTVLFAKCAYL